MANLTPEQLKWAAEKREQQLAKKRAESARYYQKYPEKSKANRAKRRAKALIDVAAYFEANKARVSYILNRFFTLYYTIRPKQKLQKRRIQRAIRYQLDPEKYRKKGREKYARNREVYIAAIQRYRDKNPYAMNAWQHNRLRKAYETGYITNADIVYWFEQQNQRCYWCCKYVTKYHVDHVIPISRGGTNTRNNIRIACPQCNSAKSALMPMDFAIRLLSK